MYPTYNSNLVGQGYIIDPNTVTSTICIANGWSSNAENFPEAFTASFGILITSWAYRTSVGDLTALRGQCLIWEGNIAYRYYNSDLTWSKWIVTGKSRQIQINNLLENGNIATEMAVIKNSDNTYTLHFYKDYGWIGSIPLN